MVLDGAINGRAFLAWVQQFLAPVGLAARSEVGKLA
jgi:hypothetical protein